MRRPLLAALALAAAACSATGGGSAVRGGTGGAALDAGLGDPDADIALDGAIDLDAAPGDGAAAQVAEVFGHSERTLYRLDPTTKAVKQVGSFNPPESVIDIALDKQSNLYATSFSGLWRVDKATAKLTLVKPGNYPNSLSFVPAGTVDANAEALVGYDGSTYERIDPASGAISTIGTLGGGFTSSGDIVSVIGGPTYLTAHGPGCDTGDCLLEVNPATGDLVKNWGSLPYASVFGLAFWAGSVYGFDDGGDIFEIQFLPGNPKPTTTPIPFAGALGLSYWGAGSTTSAPVSPVH